MTFYLQEYLFSYFGWEGFFLGAGDYLAYHPNFENEFYRTSKKEEAREFRSLEEARRIREKSSEWTSRYYIVVDSKKMERIIDSSRESPNRKELRYVRKRLERRAYLNLIERSFSTKNNVWLWLFVDFLKT